MPTHDFPSNDPNSEFRARIEQALRDSLQRAQMMNAQVRATKDRTEDEAQAMASATCEAAYMAMTGDANIQGFAVCGVPYAATDSAGKEMEGVGFSSSMRGGMSAAMSQVVMRELIPFMAKEWEPKFWERFKTCVRILFLKPKKSFELKTKQF